MTILGANSKPGAQGAPVLRAGALLITLTIALLTFRLLTPPPRTVDVGAPGDAYLLASFYQAERAGDQTFRWSGPNSQIQLPTLAAQAVLVSIRLHSNVAGQQVYLIAKDALAPLAILTASQGWQVYHVLLPPGLLQGGAAPLEIQLITSLVQPGASDPRELGVAIDWVRLQPLASLGALSEAAQQAALLGWALALVGGALWVAARAWAPAAAGPAQRRLALGLLAAVAAGLLVWAWRDPYGLRWLLPLRPWPLAVATLALAGVGWRAGARGRARWPALAWRGEVVAAGALLALAHLAVWAPLPAPWRGGAALIILWAPGWLVARALCADEPDRAARLLLGVCGALGLQAVLLLAFAFSPPGLSAWGLLLACDLLALLGGALLWRRPPAPPAAPHAGRGLPVLLGLILVLAAGLRLPALGSAELHDDEASVLLAAARLVGGSREALLTQLKGPVQILLPAGPLALTGQLPELAARLPFALAGLGVVVGGFALARRLAGGGVAGLLAALFLALDGLMIAFSRIVQYQSVVVVLLMGALWCGWRFAEGAPAPRRLLTSAALLLAVALLGHYDAIFAAPALGWMVVAGIRRRGWRPATWARALAWPALTAGGLLAAFYVPFALHPHFAEAVGHLSERTGQSRGGAALYNNLASTYGLLSFYNHGGWVALLGLLLAGGLTVALAHRARPRPAGWLAVALVAGLAGADLARGPGQALLLSATPAALLLWGLPLGALALAPRTPAALRALLIWAGAGGAATLFLIAQPRTHVYVAVVPALLLAAWCGAALVARLRRWPGALRLPLLVGALLLGLVALLHQATLYVRQNPEYQRVYPAAVLAPLGWAGAGEAVDRDARFGFPTRDGWKAVGELYRRGELGGAYASNQSSEVLAWYTRGLQRCGATPARYLIALTGPSAPIPQGYYRTGSIQVDGADRIGIYERAPRAGAPRAVALEPYVAAFDAQPITALPPAGAGCGP